MKLETSLSSNQSLRIYGRLMANERGIAIDKVSKFIKSEMKKDNNRNGGNSKKNHQIIL
jgi:DNA-directed RNA polymerase beta subunit